MRSKIKIPAVIIMKIYTPKNGVERSGAQVVARSDQTSPKDQTTDPRPDQKFLPHSWQIGPSTDHKSDRLW